MKTSNRLILGLFIAVIIWVTVNILLTRSAWLERINDNATQKIELKQD